MNLMIAIEFIHLNDIEDTIVYHFNSIIKTATTFTSPGDTVPDTNSDLGTTDPMTYVLTAIVTLASGMVVAYLWKDVRKR
ncbi:MAG: hypothetical protein ACFFDT_11555 [Candidatus Hodarchaeota archaeon]